MDKAAVLAEIDAVLARCGISEAKPRTTDEFVKAGSASAMIASLVAAIQRNQTQPAYMALVTQYMNQGHYDSPRINKLGGVLLSIRQDVEDGFVRTLQRRTEDVVFDDLLDMAAHIEKMHAAPAIVLAVSVLEERVRSLAEANSITVETAKGTRSFEDLVTDLYGQGVLTKPEFRSMGGWYSQRTEAAHGRFENVTSEEAPRIIASVRDFLVRHP